MNLVVLLFAFFLTESFSIAAVIDRLEASVNNSLILQSDIKKFRRTQDLRSKLDPLFNGTALAARGPQASDSEIRDFLIDEKIILQQFSLSDTEIEQEIGAIQSNNRIDRAGLKLALKEQGYSFEDYFELIRAGASKRNLIDRDIRTKATISDDDVKNYYFNRYARNSSAPLEYRLQLISITLSNYKTLSAAKEVISRVQGRLRAGESFDEVAKQMSDHPTASLGGDLGSLTEDQMSPQIREQIKKIKIGQISEIFGGTAAAAFFIVKIKDIQSNDLGHFAKVKEEIRAQLLAAEFQRQILLWLDRQRQQAFIFRSELNKTPPGVPNPKP